MAHSNPQLGRRAFLSRTGCVAAAALSRGISFAAQGNDPPAKSSRRVDTYTFKTVNGLEIKADVHRPDDRPARPAVLWIHGGALIGGNRTNITRQVKEAFLDAGYALVSIDYRLAPETKLPEILADVRDAYAWLRDRGKTLLNVNAERLAVLGGSAGGYLTLMTGFCVSPRPAALVSLWGYGDIVGDWYSRPSEHYLKQPRVSKEEAWRGVSGPPTTDGNADGKARMRFYLYCRQQGLWPNEVSGFDPAADARAFDAYCPVRNVSAEYPPTLLIHGTNDTDVPYEQSVLMDRELTRHHVEHSFITVPRAGHGIGDGDPKLVADAYAAILPFVEKHLRPG